MYIFMQLLGETAKGYRKILAVFENKVNVFLLILFLVLITRIPFLNLGFGLDGDAWIVEEVAHTISVVSRSTESEILKES